MSTPQATRVPISYLVTGATRGIGLELVTQLLAHPAQHVVVAGARSPETATALHTLVSEYPGQLYVIALDTADEDSIKAAAQWVNEHLDGRLDVLINNAGITQFKPWHDLSFREVSDIYRVNTIGPLVLTAALLPALKQGNKKFIIHTSSVLGSIDFSASAIKPILINEREKESHPFAAKHAVYKASKAALNMEMLVMAGDLASDGFTVICLNPGWVTTDMGHSVATDDVKPALTPQQSVASMIAVLDNITPNDNGRNVDYDGSTMPW